MSRVYDYASQGTWSLSCCPRCAGDNQRLQADGNQTFWWWGNPTDSVCGLCRAECDADEQDAYDREAESRANQLAWEATLAASVMSDTSRAATASSRPVSRGWRAAMSRSAIPASTAPTSGTATSHQPRNATGDTAATAAAAMAAPEIARYESASSRDSASW